MFRMPLDVKYSKAFSEEKGEGTESKASRFNAISPRTAAIVAGVGLLLMAILSPIAYLNTFQKLVKFDDAILTAQNILNSLEAFRMCVYPARCDE
jgi:hypothetical protein